MLGNIEDVFKFKEFLTNLNRRVFKIRLEEDLICGSVEKSACLALGSIQTKKIASYQRIEGEKSSCRNII